MNLTILVLSIFITIMSLYNVKKYRSLIKENNKIKEKYENYQEEVRKRNNEIQKQYIAYDKTIDNLWKTIETLELEKTSLERRLKYAQSKTTEHEKTIAKLTWDKSILKGRRFKKN